MTRLKLTRRATIGAALSTIPALATTGRATAETPASNGFEYEVQRTDAEWRAMLSENEYKILRQGGTEAPKSDPMWDSTAAGIYSCKGCELPAYDARWKVVLDMGWLFFGHSEPNAVLTDIDRTIYNRFSGADAPTTGVVLPEEDPLADLTPEERAVALSLIAIEIHCRRCGSHFGHIVHAKGKLVHCVNGTSFSFDSAI